MTPRIESLEAFPWDIELNAPFGIATGVQERACNVWVRLRLSDGTVGLGEAAPFPAVNGETQAQALAVLQNLTAVVAQRSIADFRAIANEAAIHCAQVKSALCAIETALLDAHCQTMGISLWAWAGGSEKTLHTDITIPTGSVQAASDAARDAAAKSFTTLKIKVGAIQESAAQSPLHHDAERVRAVLARAPAADLILDGNAAFTAEGAVQLITDLGPLRARVRVFEQPTGQGDLDGLRTVRTRTGISVAADESAGSVKDIERIAREAAADIINIKIMKSGVFEAMRMIEAAKGLGLGLMIGGMVETDLAMTVSACLAAGMGGFDWVDLDTPLFMKGSNTHGGVQRHGNRIDLDPDTAGHGVRIT